MPLTHLVKGLQTPATIQSHAQALYFRNTILVYVEVDAVDLFPDNWIYVHSDDVLHGRITNFRNWSKELYGGKQTTILCLEYWCFDQDEIWQFDADKMGALAEAELRKMQLLKNSHHVLNSTLLRVPKCYPVYETGYQQHLQPVQAYLDTVEGLLVIGRYGAFKYNNQDHSILMGLLAAEQIKSGRSQNLWSINTDDEYQEEAESDYTLSN
jgi:protoporphyrinogen oxidase